jgi:glucose/arabinose dehydrogenase
MTETMIAWTPAIAPSGLTYYNSDYIPQWKNSLLGVTLKGTKLLQLKLNDSGDQITSSTEFYTNTFGRLAPFVNLPTEKFIWPEVTEVQTRS